MPALVPDVDLATFTRVSDFLTAIRLQARRPTYPITRQLDIHGITVDDGAQFLLPLIIHLDQHPETEPEHNIPLSPGIVSCSLIRSKALFFKLGHRVRLGLQEWSGGEVSFGPGPERAVHRRSMELLAEDRHFWQQAPNSRFSVPRFTPGDVDIPARHARFKAYGSLLAIHCYTLGTAPLPVSIWLLYALCMGPSAMLMRKQYLAALDPDAFNCLAAWFTLAPSDPIPTHFMHPFNQFLLNVMDLEPAIIGSPQTQEVHDSWTTLFMSKVLFNDEGIWKRAEFESLGSGFRVAFGNSNFVRELTRHPPVLPLLARLYDREIRDVEDISSRLDFTILMSASDDTTPYYGALFRVLLLRYLDGVGHPAELCGGLVSDGDFNKVLNDTCLRAGLLLEVATDSNIMPGSDTWLIKWRFVGLDSGSMEVSPRPLHFHTCTYEVDVKITPALQDVLLASCVNLDDPTHATPFDLWLHSQLLSRDHNTA
ncbi:hypothetical protein B0H16DRAFT_1739743 [Mycena metata]|uniref:Uncharacterized protein n=1 Tax=Mycena metata TaxID=1033252 RepID=A0AAD7HEH2_9AGAR|nr:hypothetical protein B0H16DRAFT_1739743 [Mycena metata]